MRRHKRNRRILRGFSLALALLVSAANAPAESTPITRGTLELVAETQWIVPGQQFFLGLHFQLENGWHIYWINPGDSGEPPRVQWHLPDAIKPGPMEWPAPQRIGTSSIVDYGYENSVMLIVPMRAEPSLARQTSVRLDADVKLLVCSHEMCVPGKAQLSLPLPIKSRPPAPDARTAAWFSSARKALPQSAPAHWKFSVDDANDSFVLSANLSASLSANLGHPITQAVFFPLKESQIANAAPQELLPTAAGFRLTLRKSDQLLKPIRRLKGVLTVPGNPAYLIDVR